MARRKKSKGRRKKGMFQLVKGVVYVGAVGAPLYVSAQQHGGGMDGAVKAIQSATFVDPVTNKFSLAHGAQIWSPVAAVAAIDFVTSKIGLQRKIAQGFSGIF